MWIRIMEQKFMMDFELCHVEQLWKYNLIRGLKKLITIYNSCLEVKFQIQKLS